MMLLILVPIIWLAVAAFFVLLCRGAARADSVLTAAARPSLTTGAARGTLVRLEDRRGRSLRGARERELSV
jgi:hypothetical protein